MYAGRIVEQGAVRQVLRTPQHPYTVGLMRSVPENVPPRTRLYSIPGTPPSLLSLPDGCAFASRCPQKSKHCEQSRPHLENETGERAVACFNRVEAKGGAAA